MAFADIWCASPPLAPWVGTDLAFELDSGVEARQWAARSLQKLNASSASLIRRYSPIGCSGHLRGRSQPSFFVARTDHPWILKPRQSPSILFAFPHQVAPRLLKDQYLALSVNLLFLPMGRGRIETPLLEDQDTENWDLLGSRSFSRRRSEIAIR